VFIAALLAFLASVESASVARHLHNEVGTDIISSELRASQHVRHQSFPEWIANVPSSWFGKGDPARPEVMSSINQFRAKICYDMKSSHGKKFDSFEACKKFMLEACKPGGDLNMDGDKGEHSSGHGYCKAYFSKVEEMEKELKEAEKNDKKLQAEKLESEAEEVEEGKGAKAEVAAEKEVAAAKEGAEGAGAPAPATAPSGAPPPGGKKAGAPAPAAAAGPAGAPSAGGKYPANEAWYYKSGGIDAGRFHMNEKLKLPTHGYHGPLVEHEDMVTGTADWRAEFGDSDGKSLAEVCERHPESRWCHKKTGYGFGRLGHSGSLASAHFPVIVLIAAISSFM